MHSQLIRQPKNGKFHTPAASTPRPSPEQATRQAVAAVLANLDAIVQAMIEKAADGSHLHARLLLDFAGISVASSLLPAEPAAERPSLARLLMEKLDRMAEETASTEDEPPVE